MTDARHQGSPGKGCPVKHAEEKALAGGQWPRGCPARTRRERMCWRPAAGRTRMGANQTQTEPRPGRTVRIHLRTACRYPPGRAAECGSRGSYSQTAPAGRADRIARTTTPVRSTRVPAAAPPGGHFLVSLLGLDRGLLAVGARAGWPRPPDLHIGGTQAIRIDSVAEHQGAGGRHLG